MSTRDKTNATDEQASTPTGVNTYSTGGGGVTFARRVATIYLASMLTGSRRIEIDEQPVQSLAFQTGPAHPVDDLLVVADNGRLELAVACRATPKFIFSHADTRKLVRSLIEELVAHPGTRVAVAVAGSKPEWDQVAMLCDLARANDFDSFHTAQQVRGRWPQRIQNRYSHLLKMVADALEPQLPDDEVAQRTWALLSRLRIIGFRVQSPDESDWTAVADTLDRIAAPAIGGVGLRDRLEVRAGHYDGIGAAVGLNLLRTDTHSLLDASSTRTAHAWTVLSQHRTVALGAVRNSLGAADGESARFTLPFAERRKALGTALRHVAADAGALVVSGTSGTGKSATVLSLVTEMEAAEPGDFEAVIVNFRELPNKTVELQHILESSLAEIMAELSAPRRLLVIDAADAAAERSAGLLLDLVSAASAAGAGVVAVAADSAADFVREQMGIGRQDAVQEFRILPLDDTDIEHVARTFPLLRGLLRNLPTTSLLRRLVVLDLLARTGVALEGPLSEWDCLQLTWSKVVRADGRPGHGSPQAREEALLALAAATLADPDATSASVSLDSAAVDALRADHLLAPHNLYRPLPQFAHDEVRRYATAIFLVRSGQIVDTVRAAGVPRSALSAVTLACKGHLADPTRRPTRSFSALVSGFDELARTSGVRWRDVPIEAVLETPAAYNCFVAATTADPADLRMADVLRVIEQRFTFDGSVDPSVGAPVVRLLIDHDEPWAVSKQAFEVLTSWLQGLIVVNEPQGHALREALRPRLLAFWSRHPQREVSDVGSGWPARSAHRRRRLRRTLDYRVTSAEFVETLALLGHDIDAEVQSCLRALAEDAPAFLAPAVDAPISALSIGRHDAELLAGLVEAYYIDDDDRWDHHREGVRDHQGRWKGFGPPYAASWFGGFHSLLRHAPLKVSIPSLNRVLNHAARIRVGRGAVAATQQPRDDAGAESEFPGVELDLTGERRRYIGDSSVWAWYRGTSHSRYPCTSALQAMEHFAEQALNAGVKPHLVLQMFLDGCDNLAVPGMLYGLFARHLEKADRTLDRFLVEPAVWFIDFNRAANEYHGFRAGPPDNLAHPERRRWTPREVAVWLMTSSDAARRTELHSLGERLVANGERQGLGADPILHWAANFEESRYQLTHDGAQACLEVVPPPEVVAAQDDLIAQQNLDHEVLRLQNRYWAATKSGRNEQVNAAEIAQDLTAANALLNAEGHNMRPHDAVAQVVRTAIERAGRGELEALGDEGAFAVEVVMGIAGAFTGAADMRREGQYFELGADRAAARALPGLLLPALARTLSDAGFTTADVAGAGLALAVNGPLETRLFLARGCDIVWASPCSGSTCIHVSALAWVLQTARRAEVGPWDVETQESPRVTIEGDLLARLNELDGESIDVAVLDPAIRGLGVAANTNHCLTDDVKQLLAGLLAVQRRSLVRHKERGWHTDDRGAHSLVAARALLQSYAVDGDPDPILHHLDELRRDADLLMNLLHGLAAAGAENTALADAAIAVWPRVLDHALSYAQHQPNVYRAQTWGSWAAAALLPFPLPWTQGMYNELADEAIDWVDPVALTDLVERWLPVGAGEPRCVDALIRLVRKLPVAQQATRGLDWATAVCVQGERVTDCQSTSINEWLVSLRAVVEETGTPTAWQSLVDALVVAGNSGLAAYST